MKHENVVICESAKDLNELAISLCEGNKISLIFTSKTSFVPTIQTICSKKEFIFFTESSSYFEIVTENFESFDAFIFVNKNLNSFEKELFRQIQARYGKKTIQILRNPK
ncbi:uncharacterized protein VICG_00543 [Vittaforma corneae ATCC 50505]|uniref:Uncharacterized protein n=1 Tax=Vittaforma corneae (strain ATCC 50505) TaxID=993615 RepID=L2GP86_VITCO|nr:uncharacterized protein VICG_00543 [Vittaforma corneae ATCC 50505]ELA42444.1 hypothetical protein VICG_00543 [Vittaforma corneae ATCC 50505]